ncbi:MAG TPA: calcium-binding protein [Allosphingosinicella sp.]|nr:calcium-binding protein [Allosphingosinicella sp.]
MRARQDNSRDLIFGFVGEDRIFGGGGRDFLYGGDGLDVIWGGDGNDLLVGEGDSDEFVGGKGDDTIWGGAKDDDAPGGGGHDKVDYSDAPASISLAFDGSAAVPKLTVKDGDGGTDTLHSIEEIKGSPNDDRFSFKGRIPDGYILKIDSGGGDSKADILNLNLASTGMKVVNTADGGILTNKDGSGGGRIELTGFHTDIIGSAYDDEIVDDASGPKSIDGGAGDDKISVSIGAANIRGGDGDDELNGGDANDVLVGGSGANLLMGNGGSDRLVVSSDGDVADGGEGGDMLVVAAGAWSGADIVLRGGAGDDVIDARAHDDPEWDHDPLGNGWRGDGEVVLEFRPGDGHDVLLGSGHSNPTPGGFDWWGTPIDPGKTWGVNEIRFIGLDVADVTLVWNLSSAVEAWPGNWFLAGEMAILVNATGDSIYLGNVAAYATGSDPASIINRTSGNVLAISLPLLMFDDGRMYFNADGLTNSHIVIGSVDSYKGAEEAYRAATDTGPGTTEGTAGDDDLAGGSGDDDIDAGDGDDNVAASAGDDRIDGGAGNDTLRLFGSAAGFTIQREADGTLVVTSLDGAEGRTVLSSVETLHSAADDRAYAIAELAGEIGTPLDDAMVSGTARDDRLFGLAGDDILEGLEGDDTIDGGDGTDRADYLGSSADYLVYYGIDGLLAVEALTGSDGLDRLVNIEELLFRGDAGLLSVAALPVPGTSAADTIIGDVRVNLLFGLGGDDRLNGAGGDDRLFGGLGDDIYTFVPGGGNDRIVEVDEEGHNDRLDLSALNPEDVILSQDSSEAPGDLIVRILATGEIVRVVGQYSVGEDHPQYAEVVDRGIEWIDFAGGISWDWAAIRAAAPIRGTSGDDVLFGAATGAPVLAGAGDDIVRSFDGGDTMVYRIGDGDDLFIDSGAWRADTLYLPDFLPGDVQLVRDHFDLVIRHIATGATVRAVNQFWFGDDDSSIVVGGFEAIRFADDTVLDYEQFGPLASALPVIGGAAGERLFGTLYDDWIEGAGGDDRIESSWGADTLSGGDGDDRLLGGFGLDLLTGGGGADTFVIDGWWFADDYGCTDRIADFVSGEDRIDLVGIDAVRASWEEDEAFTFIGGASFSGTAGELRYRHEGGDTWILGDTDGDSEADLWFVLAGTVTPIGSDFLL